MGVQGVRDSAAELVVDPRRGAVRGHDGGVHFHLLFRVAVLGFLVPFVLVLAFLAGLGVELVRREEDCEFDFGGGICFADSAESLDLLASWNQVCGRCIGGEKSGSCDRSRDSEVMVELKSWSL